MKTMFTFFSLTGLCSIMDLYSVPRIETFFVEDLWFRVLHRVSVSSSNGCVRLRWLFERFKYRGCLELWIDGRKPGAGFDFNSEIAGSIVRAALWTASDDIARVAAIEQLCLKPKTLPSSLLKKGSKLQFQRHYKKRLCDWWLSWIPFISDSQWINEQRERKLKAA